MPEESRRIVGIIGVGVSVKPNGLFSYDVEDLKAAVGHETQHLRMAAARLYDPKSFWGQWCEYRLKNDAEAKDNDDEVAEAGEAEAYSYSLGDTNASWRLVRNAQQLVEFTENYDAAIRTYDELKGSTKKLFYDFLSGVYVRAVKALPELANESYDFHIKPPKK